MSNGLIKYLIHVSPYSLRMMMMIVVVITIIIMIIKDGCIVAICVHLHSAQSKRSMIFVSSHFSFILTLLTGGFGDLLL